MQDRYVAVFSPDFDPRARGRGIGCTRVLEQAFPRLISHSTPVVQLPSITKLGTKGRAKAEMTFDLLGIVRVNPASRMNLIELGQLPSQEAACSIRPPLRLRRLPRLQYNRCTHHRRISYTYFAPTRA